MSLRRQLARWRDAGLIDEATRARIEAFEQGRRSPVVLYALGVLGAGTIALGIVSLIAANWDAIPGGVKLGSDLFLGAGLALATYLSVQRGLGWQTEILVTVFYGFTLASIALVGQVYQLGTPAYQGLLLWSASTLPLILLGRSPHLAVLVAAGLGATHGYALEALVDHLEHGSRFHRHLVNDVVATLLFASPLAYVALSRVPWLRKHRPDYSRTLGVLAWTAVFLAGFGLQFVWYERIPAGEALKWSLASTLGMAAALAFGLPRLYPELPPPSRLPLATILLAGWVSLAVGTGFARGSADFLGAVLQVLWLGLFAWSAVRLGNIRLFNLLTALLGLRLLVVYFEVFGSLLSTGVALITGGALTLLMAWVWRRKARELADRFEGLPPRSTDVA